MKTNQKGFGVVEILIIVVIVGVVGVVGWLVYDRQQNKTDSTASTGQTKEEESSKQETTTQQQKYLEVKEEGIKFKLTDVISDAYYSTEGGIVFGVRSLDNISGCKPHKVNYGGSDAWKGVATLSFDKYAAGFRTDQAPEASDFKNYPDAVRIGDNWYVIQIDDPTDCTSTDATTQAKIKAIQDALREASKTITKL